MRKIAGSACRAIGCWMLIAVASLEFGGAALAQQFERSRAIVVGVDSYKSNQWPTLRFAVADANRVAAALRAQGYEVLLLLEREASRAKIIGALRDASRQLGSSDRLLFYFGGHGYTERLRGEEVGYILPWDAESTESMISMDEIRNEAGRMQAVRHQLFVMNACFGGTIGSLRGLQVVRSTVPQYIGEITRRQARQFLSAGGSDQLVLDGGPGGLSYFTYYFIEAIEGEADLDRDGVITFPELTGYLLPRASTENQTPAVGSLPKHAMGEYVFTPRSQSVEGRPPPPVQQASLPATVTTRGNELSVVQANFTEMQQPIDDLYAAWDALDLRRYLAQWSQDAVQYIGTRQRSFSEIRQTRERLFERLAAVKVERYQLAFRGFREGVGHFDAAYDMSFRYKDGRVLRERQRESYKVRKVGGRWLIVENRDYKPN